MTATSPLTRRARFLVTCCLLLALGPLAATAQIAAPAADSSAAATRADSSVARPDTSRVRPDSSLVRTDSTVAAVPKRDSTHVITTRATPAKKGAPQPEPPYRIEADHMSGGRGPGGDVLFLDKVTITRSRTRLNSLRGRYERASGMVYLEGDVRLRDSTADVTCDEAAFSEHEDRLNLNGNVVVTDGDATLKAPIGWYDRKNGVAQLRGGVSGHEKKQRLVADQAFYQRDSMIVRARGNVVAYDDENRVQLEARAVDFDRRAHVATATGQPLMRAKDDEGHETVLHARLLRVNSEARVAEAIDSVLVERDTLRASASYARFDDASGRGVLLGSPRAWDNETQVTGDTLETIAVKRKLERVIVRGNAVIDYAGIHEANRGEKSRLTGSRVDMFVGESRIDSLIATGRARNDYSGVPKEGKTAERNLAQGDTIFVYFNDRKIDRARVQGTATGEYHAPVAQGDTTAARLERVAYDGRRIEFVIPKSKIVLDGDAHLTYRDLELHSRKVEFDSEKNTLVAEGKPQLVEKGDEVDGQLMTYDMDRRVGTIYQATTTYERGLYHGRQIRKAADNELDVLGGAYSTCDLDPPHYHFSARYMKIYLKDKLVAKPVVFYLRNVPILALPFYVFPIKPGRHSGFLFPQFEFGFNNTTGQFLRNAGYYWAPNDYFDVTGAGDYYQADPSYLLRGELNYKLLYAFDGHAEARFSHSDRPDQRNDNYAFNGYHQQTFGQHTRLSARGDFTSNRDFTSSAFSGGNLEQRLARFLNSSVQLSHYADWISLNAVVDRRQDLDANDVLQTPDFSGHLPKVGTRSGQNNLTLSAPSLSASLPTRALGSYAFLKDRWAGRLLGSTYLSLSGRFLSLETQQGQVTGVRHFTNASNAPDSENVLGTVRETRRGATTAFSLSDSRRLFGWINLSPSVFGTAVVFDHDEQGHKVVPAAVWQASSGLSATLYRTAKTPYPGLALRHVLSPSASISYSPEFPGLSFTDSAGLRRDRFKGFGDIGIFSGRKSARASFALDQRFQAKLTRGDKVTRLDNLLSWSTTGSYDFLWREDGAKHPLGPINSAVRLQPPGYLNADASASFDPYSQRPLQSFGYNLGSTFGSRGGGKPQAAKLAAEPVASVTAASAEQADFRESWSASLAYAYAGGYSGPRWKSRQSLNAALRYQLTENWVFDYQAGYDITNKQILVQRYSLTRRIHCWDAIFTRSFTLNGETEYYFRLGIRDQKEIYYERGTRFQNFPGLQ